MLYRTCPLGLTSSTSWSVLSFFKRQQTPPPHSRDIVLDMDVRLKYSNTKSGAEPVAGDQRVNARHRFDPKVVRLGHAHLAGALGRRAKENNSPLSSKSMFVYWIWIHSISSESILNHRDIFQVFFFFLKCEGSFTNRFTPSIAFFLLFSNFYYNSNSLFASFISNYFTHFYRNYKNNTPGEPRYSCTL